MKRKNYFSLAVSLLAAVFIVTGCTSTNNSSSTNDKTSSVSQESSTTETGKDTETKKEYKDELNIVISANPPSLDVHGVNSNITGGIGSHIYEPLFAMNEKYEPTPVLADSYTVSEDGKVYTINLRKGIKFHNGQEMKADDVVASMSRWLELSGKAKALLNGTVFEKVDDYTVTMTVPVAYADVMTIISASIQFPAIYPKTSIDNANGDGMITDFIGTGPYKFEEWKQDQYVHLTKYEEYQQPAGESSGFTGEKLAATPNLFFRVVTDNATSVAGLQTGQYDVSDIPQERYAELKEDENLKFFVKTSGTINLFFNTTDGIMTNPDMRQAIMACLNCEDIMLASYGDPKLYILNPGWCNPDDSMWGSEAGIEYYNQNNIEKAKELLKKAGYNNEEIILVTTPDYSDMYNATLVVQAQLMNAGINAKVESYDFATFMEHRANPKQFSLYITSNRYNLNPVQLSVLTKDWAGLDNPEVDKAVVAIRSASTSQEASAKWNELQTLLYELGTSSVLGHYSGLQATTANVEGFMFFDFPLYWNTKVAK